MKSTLVHRILALLLALFSFTLTTYAGTAPTVASDAGSKLFIARYNTGNFIARANVDGTALNATAFPLPNNAIGVTVDTVNGKLYWSSFTAGGSIGRMNLDGSGAEPNFLPGVLAIGMAVDTTNGWLYLAGGAIKRVRLDGTGLTTLISGLDIGGVASCSGVALDVPNNKLYYAFNTRIGRANLDGTNHTPAYITTAGGAPTDDVAIDRTNGKLYWTISGGNKIGRANLDGTGLQSAFLSVTGPRSLSVDPQASKVFWSDGSGVGRANLDGTGANASFLTGVSGSWGIAIGDVDTEGTQATHTGTYSDADGDTVTFSANLGSVTKTGTSSGTWTWSYTPPDGPTTLNVTITADDGAASSTTSFTVNANNIAPTIALTGASTTNAEAAYTLNLGAITDPGTDTVTAYSVNWGDGNTENFSGSPASTSKTHTYATVGSKTIAVSLTDEDGTSTGGTLAVAVIAPEIDVQQPAGTSLTDGSSTVNYGSVAAGATSDKVFTIRNPGTANLTGLGITIDGTSASEFSVTVSPTAPVAPGGSTTFTVRYAPSILNGAGTRNAALHLASNDADENPFDLALTGGLADTTPPAISGTPANITAEATSASGAVVTFTDPTATDAVDGSVTVTCVPPSGSTFAIGTTTVTCTATDAHHNSSSTSFTVTVQDTTGPVITVPANITTTATSANGATVTFSVSASDLVDGAVTATPDHASGSTFPIGTTTVTCTATDSHGNAASQSFSITVKSLTQTITFTNPGAHTYGDADFALSATGGGSGNAVTFAIVSGPASVNGSTLTILGAGDVTVRASQAAGNGYTAATPVDQTFTVAKASQAIDFTLSTTAVATDTFTLTARGGASGNPVTFAIVSGGPGTISGSNVLSFTGSGSVTVRASQAGDATYSAAPDVDQTIVVSRAPLTLVADTAYATSGAITINVLGNDSTTTGALSLTGVTQPSSGKTKIAAGKVQFTPSGAISTPVTFTYTASNGRDTGTATVTVHPQSIALGTFVGLLRRDSDHSVRGRVVLTVAAKGALSGSVRYEGSSFTLKGSLNSIELSISGKAPLPRPLIVSTSGFDALGNPLLAMSIPDLSAPGEKFTGTAERSPFSTTDPTPDAGTYTMIAELPGSATGPALAATMTCTVSTDGTVKFGGKLGTGVAVTQTGKLLSDGRLPFFVSEGTQRLGGELDFTKLTPPTEGQAVAGVLRWSAPSGAAAQLPGGIEQDYDVFGLSFTPGSNAAAMFSPAAPTATIALLVPSESPAPLVRSLKLSGAASKGTQKMSATGGGVTALTFSTNTGLFSGTRTLPSRAKRSFFGVVLQGAGLNEGRGMLIEPTTLNSVTIAP